jgi:AraC family transcriptional regulator
MIPRIRIASSRRLAGMCVSMSMNNLRTAELWKTFMPRRKELPHMTGTVFYSAEVYGADYFSKFDPDRKFEKWAAVEVSDDRELPEGMREFIFPAGLYAVFTYTGRSSEAVKAYTYIYTEWLPGSEFSVDDRPHFAVMDERYKRDDAGSEEEIWIPLARK